jgi:hypothetical protein
MASVVESLGEVARALAGTDGVEIKATIPDRQIDDALRIYGLTLDAGERYIYFFDTPDLSLFADGVIARARRVVGADHDSTIKFRPVNPEAVPKAWRKYSGFKIEADMTRGGVVKSASLTMPVAKGAIKRVVAGKSPVEELFTQEQLLFLFSLANKKLDYERVVALGPIRTWKWKYNDAGLPWTITGELWKREDGDRLFEVSIKVPVVQAAAATAGFMAFLAEVGAHRDEGQQAKTRWALEYAASVYRPPSKTAPVPEAEAEATVDQNVSTTLPKTELDSSAS